MIPKPEWSEFHALSFPEVKHMRASDTELVCHIGRKQGKTAGGKQQRKIRLKTKRKKHGKNDGISMKNLVTR